MGISWNKIPHWCETLDVLLTGAWKCQMAFQLYVWLLKYLVYKHTRESCDWNTAIININIHLEKRGLA